MNKNFFDSIRDWIGKNSIINSILSLVVMYFTYLVLTQPHVIDKMLISAIEQNKIEQTKLHDDGLKHRERINSDIDKVLRELIHITSAERVMLFELHNSGISIANIPFLKMSCTYEVLSERFGKDINQSYLIKTYKDEPLGQYYKILNTLRGNNFYLNNDISQYNDVHIDNYVIKRLRQADIKSIFLVPIFKGSEIIGILSLTSDKINAFDRSVILSTMIVTTQTISNILFMSDKK